ncbi:hypothetical protein JBKA6_0093 [Ichthyobacterium seriolicida]|uniref:Peptidyl-prolyl cis-trans isomerase n=2 Tax=Ichthyobacterium seriolicida TaxID=242600 RepID=A0A1J1DW67_9FLAO|nr:hypothetical protein JBKA6_0093 [Ichthyobacterium seriolicida]
MSSCEYFVEETQKRAVARVDDNYLYDSDLKDISAGLEDTDSVVVVNEFIKKWAKRQLMLAKARLNTSTSKKIDDIVKEYRYDLIIDNYVQQIVNKYSDSLVSEDDVVDFYNSNKNSFILNRPISKINFMEVKLDAPNIKDAEEWFLSKNEEDKLKLKDYCFEYAKNYHLDDSTWIYADDIIDKIPILSTKRKLFEEKLKKDNLFLGLKDSINNYFVLIKENLIKGEISPIFFVKPMIINTLNNKKKIEFIEKMENNLLENAIKKQQFEIFDNNDN